MRVFGVEPPPVQPPQGRSGRFWTCFSPIAARVAGQSSGSRSPEAAQAAACSSASLRQRTLPQPNTHLAIRNGCSTRARATSRCARSARFTVPQCPVSGRERWRALAGSAGERDRPGPLGGRATQRFHIGRTARWRPGLEVWMAPQSMLRLRLNAPGLPCCDVGQDRNSMSSAPMTPSSAVCSNKLQDTMAEFPETASQPAEFNSATLAAEPFLGDNAIHRFSEIVA